MLVVVAVVVTGTMGLEGRAEVTNLKQQPIFGWTPGSKCSQIPRIKVEIMMAGLSIPKAHLETKVCVLAPSDCSQGERQLPC